MLEDFQQADHHLTFIKEFLISNSTIQFCILYSMEEIKQTNQKEANSSKVVSPLIALIQEEKKKCHKLDQFGITQSKCAKAIAHMKRKQSEG